MTNNPTTTVQVHDEACFVEPINSEQPHSTTIYQHQLTHIQTEEQTNHSQLILAHDSPIHSIPSPILQSPKLDFLRSLPIELAIYILLCIGDHPQSLVNCRLVSKHWRQCAEDPIVWREIFINHPNWKVKHLYPDPQVETQDAFDEGPDQSTQFYHPNSINAQFNSSCFSFKNPLDHHPLNSNSTHLLDIQSPSDPNFMNNLPSPIPYLSRQNSIQSYRSNGSANKHVARRLSQLLTEPNAVSSSSSLTANDSQMCLTRSKNVEQNIITNQKNQNILFETECLISLDWLKLYRDRFILDRRWSDGKQVTRSLKGHKDSIYCLQIVGNQLITGSRDRTIKIWDMKTGTCTETLTGHKGSVLCVRCDGHTMLTGSSDCQVFVWEEIEESPTKRTWQVKQKLIGHQSGVLDLSLNEKLIVSCSKDTTTKIWNREDGSLVRTITGHTGPVNALELCRNPLQWIEKPTDDAPIPSNDSKNITTGLLTASGDSTMKLWELQTGRLVRTFEGHIRGLACLKLVEDNHLVVTGSNDETIKFWNLITGQCIRTLLGHSGLVRSLDIDFTQNRLVSGSYDKTIKVWDLKTGEVKLNFRKGERRLVFDVKVQLTSIVLVGHDSNIMILDFSYGLECDNFI